MQQELEPGSYLVVPATYWAGAEAGFQLRVAATKGAGVSVRKLA